MISKTLPFERKIKCNHFEMSSKSLNRLLYLTVKERESTDKAREDKKEQEMIGDG